jgi:hypothetical protein
VVGFVGDWESQDAMNALLASPPLPRAASEARLLPASPLYTWAQLQFQTAGITSLSPVTRRFQDAMHTDPGIEAVKLSATDTRQ